MITLRQPAGLAKTFRLIGYVAFSLSGSTVFSLFTRLLMLSTNGASLGHSRGRGRFSIHRRMERSGLIWSCVDEGLLLTHMSV
jgi:hypothetical protein